MSSDAYDRLPLAIAATLFGYLSSRDLPKFARACRRFAAASRQPGASPADIAIHSQPFDWLAAMSGADDSRTASGEKKHACHVCSARHGERTRRVVSKDTLRPRIVRRRDNTVAWRCVARFASARVTAHSMCEQAATDLAGSRLSKTAHSLALAYVRQLGAVRVFESLRTLWLGALDTRVAGFESLPPTLTSLAVDSLHTPADLCLTTLARTCPELVRLDLTMSLDERNVAALSELAKLESLRVQYLHADDPAETARAFGAALRQLAFVPRADQCRELARHVTGASPRLPNFQRVTIYAWDACEGGDTNVSAASEAALRQHMPRCVEIHVEASVQHTLGSSTADTWRSESVGRTTTAPVSWDHVDYLDSFRRPLPPLLHLARPHPRI